MPSLLPSESLSSQGLSFHDPLLKELENPSLAGNQLGSFISRIDTSTFSPIFSSLISAFERVAKKKQANPQLLSLVLTCVAQGMKHFLSARRDSYNTTDTSFLFAVLRLATIVTKANCTHIDSPTVPGVIDDKAMNEMLGSLFAHVCGNACPLNNGNLRDQDKSFVLDFLRQLLNLCHLSVCSSRPDYLRPNLAGMTWKAYKVLISKFGGNLSSSLPCDAILKEWSTIFKSVYVSLNNSLKPGNQIDSSLKYLRYCVVVVISVVQSIVPNTPMVNGGGLQCLIYQIACVRTDLPPSSGPSKWPEGIEGKIASQLLSPLDSLFIHLLSSTPLTIRGDLLRSFVSGAQTHSSTSSPIAKLSLLLSLMMHGPQSFPFDAFQSCFDWVLESPLTCFPSYVDNRNPKATPLFYKVTLAVFTYIAALQDPNDSTSAQKALVRLVSYAFHHHYLTREIAKESWSLLIKNGTERTKASTRQVIISLVNNLASIQSRYSQRILSRVVSSIAPFCFSEENPFPISFPPQLTKLELNKFLRKSVFISPRFLSSTQRRSLCESGCTWCVRACAGYLKKKDPAFTLEEVDLCLQFFSWILSHPSTFELVPVFSRQKISELVIQVISSPNHRNPSCLQLCLKAIGPLFGYWSPQEQLSCLQGMEATYGTDPNFAGPILRLVGQVSQHLKESPYLAKVYQIVVQLLSKGLSHTGDSIEAIAVFSTLELMASCCYETQYLLAAFGEHQQKIRNLVLGEAPASSVAIVEEMAQRLAKKPSRKRKGEELSPPQRSFNQGVVGGGGGTCEEEIEHFMGCLRRLEGALVHASPQVQQGVVSRMKRETNRVCSRFGGASG